MTDPGYVAQRGAGPFFIGHDRQQVERESGGKAAPVHNVTQNYIWYHEDTGHHRNWTMILIGGVFVTVIGGIVAGICWIAARLLAMGGW